MFPAILSITQVSSIGLTHHTRAPLRVRMYVLSTSRAYINPTTTPLLEEPVVMVISNTTFALYKIPKSPSGRMLTFRSGLMGHPH